MKKRIGLKTLFLSLMVLMLTITAMPAMPAKALSYPILSPEELEINAHVGETVTIKYAYFPAFKNEKIEVYLYDPSGTLIAGASETFYNYYSDSKSYSLNWDTKSKKPGTYKAVAYKYFYSLYSWHEAPSTTTVYINLTCNHTWDAGTVTKQPTTTSTGTRTYTCTKCGETKTAAIAKLKKTVKKANTIKVALLKKVPQVKASALKNKAVAVKKAKLFKITKAKGKVTFKKVSGSKYLTISKAGVLKVKKGTGKGVYKAKIAVTAAGNSKFKKKVLYKTVKVIVK